MPYQLVNFYSIRTPSLIVPIQNIKISGLDEIVDNHFPKLQEKRVRPPSKCSKHYIPGIGEIESDIEIDDPEKKDTPREKPEWPVPPGYVPPPTPPGTPKEKVPLR